jgi:hypothetical protein
VEKMKLEEAMEWKLRRKTKVMRISRPSLLIQVNINRKQLENGEYFSCFGSMITNDARCKHKIKYRTSMAKTTFKMKQIHFYKQVSLKFKDESSKLLHLEHSLYGAENWSLRNRN